MKGLAQHLTFCKYSVLVFLPFDYYGHRKPIPSMYTVTKAQGATPISMAF